jgi:hypothetical protein
VAVTIVVTNKPNSILFTWNLLGSDSPSQHPIWAVTDTTPYEVLRFRLERDETSDADGEVSERVGPGVREKGRPARITGGECLAGSGRIPKIGGALAGIEATSASLRCQGPAQAPA